eukprot:scaffold95438_cov96-Attheya_sp.AAC.1
MARVPSLTAASGASASSSKTDSRVPSLTAASGEELVFDNHVDDDNESEDSEALVLDNTCDINDDEIHASNELTLGSTKGFNRDESTNDDKVANFHNRFQFQSEDSIQFNPLTSDPVLEMESTPYSGFPLSTFQSDLSLPGGLFEYVIPKKSSSSQFKPQETIIIDDSIDPSLLFHAEKREFVYEDIDVLAKRLPSSANHRKTQFVVEIRS